MKKKFVPGIASVVGVSILLTGCGLEASGANAKDEAPSKQVLNLSSPTEIRTMDTARATDTDSGQVMRNVFEGLYNLGEGNKPVPGVAKSHEVSGDKTKYTFHEIQNGQTVLLLQQKILSSLGKELSIQQQPLNMHFYSLILKINNKELPADQLGVKG